MSELPERDGWYLVAHHGAWFQGWFENGEWVFNHGGYVADYTRWMEVPKV